MNLDQAISIYAGGPGSGCNPEVAKPGCGRPKGSGKEEKEEYEGKVFKGPKAQPLPETIKHPLGTVGTLVTRPGQVRKYQEKSEQLRQLNSKDMQKYQEKLERLRQQGRLGGQSEQEKKNLGLLEPKDKVVLAKPTEVFEHWRGEKPTYRTLPVGYQAKVIGVIDRNGILPAIATINLGKKYGKEMVPLEDLQLLQKDPSNKVRIPLSVGAPDISKSKIAKTGWTQDGARYTVLKPSTVSDEDVNAPVGKTIQKHSGYGQFREAFDTARIPPGKVQVLNDPNYRGTMYTHQSAAGKRMKDPLMGTTVWAYRRYDQGLTTIVEVTTGRHGAISGTYSRVYRNQGMANTYLSRRFGIKTKLPNWKGKIL